MQEKSSVTDDQEDEGTFIANNFSYKECTTYVEKDGQQGSCHCGLPKAKHGIEALKAEAKKWSTQHIAIRKPTNICGTHTLESGHQIKFLRLADSDDPAKLLELMCKYWHMQDERALTLVLSLTTNPSEGFPEDVEEGLTHSVLVNSCWIISAGYEAAAKLEEVGRKRLSSKHGNFDFCNVCIMPWRQDLLQLWQGQSPESKDMAAFKKYTHCLFVDNGQEKQSSVSATNEFRHRLEELIQTEAGLPVLRILIGGELKDLVPVLMGLKSGLPLLLCSGTDGLADIIAQALSYAAETPEFHDFTPAQQAHLKSLLKNQDPKQDETNVSWSYKLLLKVVKFAPVISVFRCHSDGAFDEKIFESFAKSQDQRGLQALIRWAFIKDWQDPMDRLDNNIWMAFMCDVIQKPLCLCDFRENVDILQLCLEQGLGAAVSDKRHVADCKISSMLLNSVSVMLVPGMFVTFLTQLTDMKTWSLQMEEELEDVMAELRETEQHAKTAKSKASEALRDYYAFRASMQSKYGSDWLQAQGEFSKSPRDLHKEAWKATAAAWQAREKAQQRYEEIRSDVYKVCEKWLVLPALWAVIFGRYEIAQLFWQRCKDPISAGLAVSRACDKLMQILPQYDTDNYEKLDDEETKFENFSVQLIERYNSEHPCRAVELLQMNAHYIPDQISCSLFICSLPIQYIVEHDWWNGFSANPVVIMISFFFPFLVCTPLFSFAPVPVQQHSPLPLASPPPSGEKKKRRNPTCLEKFRKFYTAPITKFYTHALFYLAFVFFYAYTVAVGFREHYVSIFEILVVVGLISFFSETVFEVIPMLEGACRYTSFTQTLIDLPPFYKYDSVLNAFNVVTIVLGLGRFVSFQAIKTLYVVSFLLHSFRFFKFYYFYSNLGPKLAMMGRMVREMLEFLTFLLVFLLATGVAMEGLLFVNRTNFNFEVVREIFLIQFYRLYGENNLELARGEVEGCTTPDGVNCPVSNPLAPWLLNLFLLIVVTLLMNLLIAIFSNVFDEFESESREIWKRTRCRLLFEFKDKTILPMPFNVIERFIRLFIAIFRACQRSCRRTVEEHKIVKITETTPLKGSGRQVNKQVKLIHEQLKAAAKKAQIKRMDTYLQYIRRKCLPRFLKDLENAKTDVSAELLDLFRNKIDVEIKDLVQTVSDLHLEITELKEDAENKSNQVMKRLDELAKLLGSAASK